MLTEIIVKEAPVEDAVKVNSTIVEFDKQYKKDYFETRIKDKDSLITVAYKDNNPVGYMVWYDRDNDNSLYCWMAGVNPNYRKLGSLKKLMEYGVIWAKNNGYTKIKIKTRNNRLEMLLYLIKNGFLLTNVVQYPDIDDNRLELEKSL